MRKNSIYALIFLFSTASLLGQTQAQRENITQLYNTDQIHSLKKQFQTQFERKSALIDSLVANTDQKRIIITKDGSILEAMEISPNGKSLIYYALDNIDAAKSTRTNYLNPSGGLGLSLEGENMIVGIWEQSSPLLNHNEYSDGLSGFRSSKGDNAMIGNSDDHATHVGGTIIARGVDPMAKGMAPKGEAVFYSWNNDETETANAANNGLLLSNHSYGVPIFWTDDDGTTTMQLNNWQIGKYSQTARSWDMIAYAMPYYLMVTSAGNEGYEFYQGGLGADMDKLTYNKVSKNNLVVANAEDAFIDSNGDLISVNISGSSSQGPSDDGRIKPDIAGNGTQVYSSIATSPSSYASFSGTSMASPNVTGTLLLLQELYFNTHGNYMLSATLKGLACHTASDAGALGPDPYFGWGLLNAKKAAETIMDTAAVVPTIQEKNLSNGQSYFFQVEATGTEPLIASITWTDPAGNIPNNNLNDSTPILTNDLDIRIVQNDVTYFPYKLDLSNLSGNAITGDNSVDNVERINVQNPSGTYTVTISHKGTLINLAQNYSLIITGGTTLLNASSFSKESLHLWPNPVDNTLNIALKKIQDLSGYTIELYDLQGRLVTRKKINTMDRKNQQIDMSKLQSGMYIFKLSNGAISISEKIIKN